MELFRNSIRDVLALKKLAIAAVLTAVPVAIALIWRSSPVGRFQPEVAYNTISAGLIFGFILVILSVIFGTGVISQDVEQKGIVYLLTHAMPRWQILSIKFVVAFLATTITVWISSLALAIATFGIGDLNHTQCIRDLQILPVGALAYGALFLLLATLVSRPLIFGLLFAFGWESWAPNLPGDFRMVSLMSYLRVLSPHPQPQSDAIDLSQLLTVLNPSSISSAFAWQVLVCEIVLCIASALLVFSFKEYVPKDAE